MLSYIYQIRELLPMKSVLIDMFTEVEQSEANYVIFSESSMNGMNLDLQAAGLITYGMPYPYREHLNYLDEDGEPYVIDNTNKENYLPFFICNTKYFI